MFCGKCGTKNVEGARFCEKCGEALNDENENKPEQLKNRIASLPKKTKIVMGSVLVIVVIAIIALLILLNKPEKKVSDSLNNYYNNYKENYVKDLQVIEDVLKDHRKDSKVLKRIKDNSGDTITSWVKNLNTTYKSLEDFETAYKKVSNILVNIYSYFNGLDYILSDSLYQSLSKELRDLYSSKVSYLRGEEASDGYTKYSYFQRVIESDSYYKKAQEYIKDYTKEELTNFKEKALEYTSFDEGTTDDEKLSGYIEQLAFLNKNKIVNNIDVSSTEDYQSIYNNAIKNIYDLTKAKVAELEKNYNYYDAIEVVKNSLESITDKECNEYIELTKLKTDLENNKPDMLVDKYVVDYLNSNDEPYSITLNDKEYKSYLYFSFKGKNAFRTYRLNNAYKKLRTKIVVGPDWPGDFSGEIVITAGDKELFRSGKITKTGEFSADIDIDITDVDDLKIEFQTTNDAGWENFYLYLVEPYLYK